MKFWEPSGTHLSRKGYNLCSLISSQVFCFCNYYQNRIKTLLVHTCFTLECLKRENNSVTLLNQGRWRLCVYLQRLVLTNVAKIAQANRARKKKSLSFSLKPSADDNTTYNESLFRCYLMLFFTFSRYILAFFKQS